MCMYRYIHMFIFLRRQSASARHSTGSSVIAMGNKASVEAELREQCRLDAARAASDRRRRAAAHTLENITKLASAGMHQDLARELAKIDVAHLRSFAGPVGLVAWVQCNLL